MNTPAVLRRALRFERPQVLAAQMVLVDRNLPYAHLASCLIIWLSAVAGHALLGLQQAWYWAVGATLLTGLAELARRLVPAPSLPESARIYARTLLAMSVLRSGSWLVMGLLYLDPAQPASLLIVLGMMAGANSGAMAIFAPSWPVALAWLMTNILPVCMRLFSFGDPLSQIMGLAVALYFLTMALFAYNAAGTVLRGIELGFENEGLVGRLRDQTQRALEAREVAEQALQEAEQANRAKTMFLASASHDLRQPLHAMGLFLGTLGRTPLSDRQAYLLQQAQAASQATGDMLATLLDFSKVDAGVIKPHVAPFALQPLFHKLEAEMAPLAEEKGLAFRLRDTTLVLQADAGLVELILRNLLLNAIRYTEHGAVLMACRRRGERAVIEVWDTGIGIPAEQHEIIFREFHQLGNPERDRRKGLGLGLAIVDGLARAMSVDVSLASRQGRGSVFRLSLPVSQQPWQEAGRPVHEEPDLSGLKVLLVDDDDTVRVAMLDLLASWGCWCELAASADEALALLDGFEPDVMLADYRLRSHRTGLQAIDLVRLKLGRPLPAAIVTGDTAPERLREAASSGLPLLHKPVPSDRLQAVLADLWLEANRLTQSELNPPRAA